MPDSELIPPSALPEVSAQPQHNFFRGPNGIRAGWRVVIFLALVCAMVLVLVGGVALIAHGRAQFAISQLSPQGLGISEAAIFLCTAIPALIMSKIERRNFGAYGLPARSAFRGDFWIGTLIGFLSIGGCLLGIFAFHGFHLTGFAIHGSTIVSATAAWALAFVIVGLAEEFAFRGYLQFTLTTGIGFWPSAILLSALFGAAHAGNPGESKAGLASVVLFGLLFCLFLKRRGSLWWAVGFHAGWDWGQTFFYGVPDSGILPYHNLFNCSFTGPAWLTGGSVGPEASIFTPAVLIIVAAVFANVYKEDRYQA